eukprot:scaffold216106_cov32-Tisochrysis_lutea.AAC.1
MAAPGTSDPSSVSWTFPAELAMLKPAEPRCMACGRSRSLLPRPMIRGDRQLIKAVGCGTNWPDSLGGSPGLATKVAQQTFARAYFRAWRASSKAFCRFPSRLTLSFTARPLTYPPHPFAGPNLRLPQSPPDPTRFTTPLRLPSLSFFSEPLLPSLL